MNILNWYADMGMFENNVFADDEVLRHLRGYVMRGRFGLADEISCRDCSSLTRYFYVSCTDRIVLRVISNYDVHVVNLEKVFQSSGNEDLMRGGCCDYLLYSDTRLVLADLSCSRPNYVEKKRATAYRQTSDSIDKLRLFHDLAEQIERFERRDAMLAVRKKEFALEHADHAVVAMSSFLRMELSPRVDMGNGFFFSVFEYPRELEM